MLLKALQARAAGIALEKLKGVEDETAAQLTSQIEKLVASTGLSEARLADELDHDIKRWEWFWETLRRFPKRKAREGAADKSVPLGRALRGGLVHSRYGNNPHVETSDGDSNSNVRTTPSAPPSRATAGPVAEAALVSAVPQAMAPMPMQVVERSKAIQESPDDSAPASRLIVPNKRGSPAVKMAEAIDNIVGAVTSGTITLDALRRMKQKELQILYPRAGRTLLAQAREAALSTLALAGYFDGTAT